MSNSNPLDLNNSNVKRRPMSEASAARTQAAVQQPADHDLPRQGPLATATVNVGSKSSVADNSQELGADAYSMKNDAVAELQFPLCDAAVQKIDSGDWDLADAILAECSETGDAGVRNELHALMKAMRDEIAKNRGVALSFERVRKLRKVASAFPAGRRRPGVSLEAHLEAGTPDALDAFISDAPSGTSLTRNYIRGLKHPDEKAEQDQQKTERRRQIVDQRTALQKLCREQEMKADKLMREKEELEQRYTTVCRSLGKEPEPISPALVPEGEPPLTVAEDLERAIAILLIARGFDPKADQLKRAIGDLVKAALVQAQ